MYQETNKNYDFLFIKPEEEARRLVEEINMLMGKYHDSHKLKQVLIEKYGDETFDLSYLNELIDRLNSNENSFDEKEIIEEIANISNVREVINLQSGDYTIIMDQGKLEFSDIGDFIGKINNSEKSKEMKEFLIKVSSLHERMNHCHAESINLALLLERDLGISCKIVTGYASYFVSKNRYMHTWNELTIDGKEYVIDSTMNTCINKDGYYLLRNIDEKENITSLDSKIVKDDFKNHIDFIEEIDLKTYLTCRDEVMTEYLEKKKLFKNSIEGDER